MKNGPEFLAIGVWCLFVAVIAVAHGTGTPDTASQTATVVASDASPMPAKLTTGRSAAISADNGPYGALFVDPSLQADAQPPKVKPTSADLTAR